jgi:hypothetical protein
LEAFGRGIASTGILQNVLSGLSDSAAWVAETFGGAVPQVHGLKNAINGTATAAGEAETALKELGTKQDEFKTHTSEATGALTRQLEALRNLQRFEDEKTDARMARDLAKVDAAESSGDIKPADAIQSRSAIRTKAETEKQNRAQEADAEALKKIRQKIEDNNARAFRELEGASSQVDQNAAKKWQKDLAADSLKRAMGHTRHWERNTEAFEGDPTNFSNSEIGETAGHRTVADMSRISIKLAKQLQEARDYEDLARAVFKNVEGASPDQIKLGIKREDGAVAGANSTSADNEVLMRQAIEIQRRMEHRGTVFPLQMETEGIKTGAAVEKAREVERQKAAEEHQRKMDEEVRARERQNREGYEGSSVGSGQSERVISMASARTVNEFSGLGETIVQSFDTLHAEILDLRRQLAARNDKANYDFTALG